MESTKGGVVADDITVGKDGIAISWKLFVGAVIAMIGFYMAAEVAPLKNDIVSLQIEVKKLSATVEELSRRVNHSNGGQP